MHKTLWQNVQSEIRNSIDHHVFDTWFHPLFVKDSVDSATLTLAAPNQFIADFCEEHYKQKIISIATKFSPDIKNLVFIVEERNQQNNQQLLLQTDLPIQISAPPFRQPLFKKRFTFESFVEGSGNDFAKSAALAVAEAPGKTKFNPLLIYGGVGLGKTHLLQSIGNFIVANSPTEKIIYISSEEFYLNFIDAIKNNQTKKFTEPFRNSDILLMDDVQFFSGKESTQEEFFYIFNTLHQNGKQIVLTSDTPPQNLRGLQDRLVSRFQWGLAVDIQPPNLETRVAILKKKAEEDNLNIPENILYYIAENISSNIRELEGIIIRLLAHASITKKDITLELVKSVLDESNKKDYSKISIDQIIEKVAEYFMVPPNNIREKNRHKEVALSRHVAMYIAKSITNMSLKTIGLHFGGRDHSTVIHAIGNIEELKKKSDTLMRDINTIIASLK